MSNVGSVHSSLSVHVHIGGWSPQPWLTILLGDGNSKLKPVCLAMPSQGMERLFRQMGRMKSLSDSTVQKAIQQHAMEHEEHNRDLGAVSLNFVRLRLP